jgi:hypothetical protein
MRKLIAGMSLAGILAGCETTGKEMLMEQKSEEYTRIDKIWDGTYRLTERKCIYSSRPIKIKESEPAKTEEQGFKTNYMVTQ